MSDIPLHLNALWPTFIIEGELPDSVHTSIDKIIDQVEFVSTPKEWGKTHKVSKPLDYSDDRQSFVFTDDVIERYDLKEFAESIDIVCREYARLYNMPFLKYKRSSWFTLFEKGDYAHIHDHKSSAISGVYYYKTSGKDGNIFFNSSLSFVSSNPAYAAIDGRHEIQTKENKLIIFPGWLKHGVMTNETDESRISLSFNIEFDFFNAQRKS